MASGTKPKLTAKQERFIVEYLIDLNATQAAIRSGYSRRTANRTASKNLRNAGIAKAIAERQRQRLAEADLSAARTLEELRRILHADPAAYLDAKGNLLPIHQLSPEARAAIASIEVVMKNATAGDNKIDRVLKIKWWDKTRALDLAMRHFALLVDKVDVTIHSDQITQRLLAGRERATQTSSSKPN